MSVLHNRHRHIVRMTLMVALASAFQYSILSNTNAANPSMDTSVAPKEASGSADSVIESAEQLIVGSPSERLKAISLLEPLAADANPKAMLVLGRVLVWSGDAVHGVNLLNGARKLGLSEASFELGNAYLWGTPGLGANVANAQRFLEEAAEESNVKGMRVLGEQLLTGWALPPDKARGEKILIGLIEKGGDPAAKLALGRVYIAEPDSAEKVKVGVKLLEEAGTSGEGDAFAVLGKDYLWGGGGLRADPQKALEYLERAASSKSIIGLRLLGEQLIDGGILPRDLTRGEAILEKLTVDGDNGARLALGRAYLSAPAERDVTDRGVELLKAAGASGLPEAYAVLGEAYLWGTKAIQADQIFAKQYLEKAAEAKDSLGLRVLGEQLVTGWILPPDPARGLPMLEMLASKDDPKAKGILGRLLLNGENVKKNRALGKQLLLEARQAGDLAASEVLGSALMWTGRSSNDKELARKYLTQAANGGRGQAWLTLAQGATFGKLGNIDAKTYALYLGKARQTKQFGIEVLQAQRALWGLGEKRLPSKAMSILEAAAKGGNTTALVYLISLVRDGEPGTFKANKKAARRYLSTLGGTLPKNTYSQQSFLIDAASQTALAPMVDLAKKILDDPSTNNLLFRRDIFNVNPNLSVLMAQIVMKNEAVYDGAINALATSSTISAIKKYCANVLTQESCPGPIIGGDVLARIALQ